MPGTVSLLERSYAGLRVEVLYERTAPIGPALTPFNVSLLVQEGEREPRVVKIDPAKARDAFDHPYCYLPA